MTRSARISARSVIVCADDFAVNASASQGIAKLAQMGRLSATSAMVLSERWEHDVALLKQLRGQLDVGLHLDWTSDFAFAHGHGMPLGKAMHQALLGGFDAAAASAVIERQLDAFEHHWLAPPDFVDGHQHVHQFAGIREALVSVLVRRYGAHAVKPYLRIARVPAGWADIKSRVITWMGADALEKMADLAQLPHSQALLGVYDFAGGPQRFAALMQRWLARTPHGAIVMCHPAQAAEPDDEIGVARAQELAYLSSPEFALVLQSAKLSLVRGRDVHPPLKSSRD